ncbi:hypothetical protein TNCV_2568701 [Trichonephila clavipes]|uniref:Uncharacterized protein n=1 Tax=Trichonephila clavipes TaxID=2585209 RepID=A0A8X6WKR7_TRICX|nr:hypothetical protein TNCV_2568701 [Trichonephila clavipes]
MSGRNLLEDFTSGRMIGKLEERRDLTSAAEEFGINKNHSLPNHSKRYNLTSAAVNVVLHSNTKAMDDGPQNFESWLNDET